MRKPVKTKQDFVLRFIAGEFGNKGPNWDSLEDWTESVPVHYRLYRGYHIRSRTPGGETLYDIYGADLPKTVTENRGSFPDGYYLAEMAPHDLNVIQGEVQRTYLGLTLRYTTVKGWPMRDALGKQSTNVQGLAAKIILQQALCPNSWEWLNFLLDEYNDHVVEFSTFSTNWGTIPGYNTVFWEVRQY